MKSGELDEVSEQVESSIVVVSSCQKLVVHWHSSCDQKFEWTKKKIIKFMLSHVNEASLKSKVFVCSNVLGCL